MSYRTQLAVSALLFIFAGCSSDTASCLAAGCTQYEPSVKFGVANIDDSSGEAVCELEEQRRPACINFSPRGRQNAIGVYYRDTSDGAQEAMVFRYTVPDTIDGWILCDGTVNKVPACVCFGETEP